MMLTVGIGNSVFHTMCVIIATLFSNCILCKYCIFLFIVILVHVRYVFIKKSQDYYTWSVKWFIACLVDLRDMGIHLVCFLRNILHLADQ